MISQKRWIALLCLAFLASPLTASASGEASADSKAKLDQCSCNYFTGDPMQPTKIRRYSSDPVCGENAMDTYFSCDDAYNVMAAQCYCVRPGEIVRYGKSGDCRYLGPLTAPNPGDSFALLNCDAAEQAAQLPKSRCYCLQPTDSPYRPYQLLRYNWAPECLASHYTADDDDPSPDELPSCADAMDTMGRCFCRGAAGVEKAGSDPSCDGMKYVALERKDGKGPILDLPACGGSKESKQKGTRGPQ